jgi:hypothetical protein
MRHVRAVRRQHVMWCVLCWSFEGLNVQQSLARLSRAADVRGGCAEPAFLLHSWHWGPPGGSAPASEVLLGLSVGVSETGLTIR